MQSLKYELFEWSELSHMLLERAAHSVEVAHALYWLLKEAANALPLFSFRYQLLFAALIYLLPRTVRLSFCRPRELSCTSMLERDNIYHTGLMGVHVPAYSSDTSCYRRSF